MNCPNCQHGLQTDRTYADFACANCGLAGPRELLEKLSRKLAFTAHVELEDRIVDIEQQLEAERDRRIEAERELERLKSPAAVLAEAERLLKKAGAQFIYLSQADGGQTMVEAYEKLRGGE